MKLKIWQKVLSLVFVIIFILLFSAPRIARIYIEKNSTELIGRKLEIDKIRLNYITGAVKLGNLKLYKTDAQTIFVSFKKLLVNIDYWPFLRKEIVVSKIKLDKFYTQVEQEGSYFNFSDMIPQKDSLSKEEPVTDTLKKDSKTITINNILLSNCQIKYTDLLLDHAISLDDLNLTIPGFSIGKGTTRLAFGFSLSHGGNLQSSLSFNQSDSSYAVNLKLDSLNLDVIEPYVKESMAIGNINGYFSNDLSIAGNLQHIMQIRLKGWNKLEAIEIKDTTNRRILSFDEFKIDIDTVLLGENEIKLNEISLLNPYFLVELIDSTNNWSALMIADEKTTPDTSQAEKDSTEATTDFSYSLSSLNFENGKVEFNDKTLNYPFNAVLHDINIQSKEVSSTSQDIDLKFSALFNDAAELKSNLNINMQNMQDIKLDFNLVKFPLKDIEPYMLHYFGYSVGSGFLNFSTDNTLTSTTLKSDNNLYVRNFILDKLNNNDAVYKLPIKLAIGVMSDKEGIIDLDVPVESDEENTTIGNLGRIVLRTFSNLIVKAATSPVDFLANIYGINSDELNSISMEISEDKPKESELAKLDVLAKILNDKPQLQLNMSYNLDELNYADSIATNKVRQQYIKDKSTAKPLNDSLLRVYVLKKSVKTDTNNTIQQLCINLIGKEKLMASYDSVVYDHVDFVRDYFYSIKNITPNRLTINTTTKAETPTVLGVFKVDFTTIAKNSDRFQAQP